MTAKQLAWSAFTGNLLCTGTSISASLSGHPSMPWTVAALACFAVGELAFRRYKREHPGWSDLD